MLLNRDYFTAPREDQASENQVKVKDDKMFVNRICVRPGLP